MIERLAPLNVDAFIDRTLGRDVFDTSFLLARYPGSILDEQQVSSPQTCGYLGAHEQPGLARLSVNPSYRLPMILPVANLPALGL